MTWCILHGLNTSRCSHSCVADTESYMARRDPLTEPHPLSMLGMFDYAA